MVNPRTVNSGLIVPLTGADVDTWGQDDVNPNMVAIDGFIAGIQNIAVTNVPVTLTSPAGFTATPTPGPTQSQNRVLRFTGGITGPVQVTLPLPGVYVIENATTPTANLLSFRAVGAGEIICIEPGTRHTVYNDGNNVRFVDLGAVGSMEMWAGITSTPLWVQNCTVQPYLQCDGTVYNIASYPALGARLLGIFGGNGVTTFAVPDLRGRFPLAYDGTGSRVTVAECGINGQTMGAALNAQSVTLNVNQIPSHYHAAGIYDPTHDHPYSAPAVIVGGTPNTTIYGTFTAARTGASATGVRVNSPNGLDTTYSVGGGLSHNNMPNTQVAGIWVIKT